MFLKQTGGCNKMKNMMTKKQVVLKTNKLQKWVRKEFAYLN